MPKKVKYSNHAIDRLKERNIPDFNGATICGKPTLDFIKSNHSFKTDNYFNISPSSNIVFWQKISKLKKGGKRSLYIYVGKYIELGVLKIITCWKMDYDKFKNRNK